MPRSKKKSTIQLAAELEVVRNRLFDNVDVLISYAKPKAIAERGLAKVSSAVNLLKYFRK